MSQPDSDNPFASPHAISSPAEIGFGPPDASFVAAAADQLLRTRPWARLVAIFSFGLGALYALGLVGVAVMAVIPGAPAIAVLGQNLISWIISSVILLIGATLLWTYTRRIGDFLNTRDQHAFENALAAHAAVWRFWGIVTIVFLVLAVLAVLLLFLVVSDLGTL